MCILMFPNLIMRKDLKAKPIVPLEEVGDMKLV